MKKIIIVSIGIIVLGVLWYVASPFFINNEVSESFPTSASATSTPEIVTKGTFTGFDRLHNGTGTVSLIKVNSTHIVRFEEDFKVTNGPDLYVGFGKDGKYIPGSEISALKGNVGSQNYELPAGFDLSKYNEVWVWCKQFAVPFTKAELR